MVEPIRYNHDSDASWLALHPCDSLLHRLIPLNTDNTLHNTKKDRKKKIQSYSQIPSDKRNRDELEQNHCFSHHCVRVNPALYKSVSRNVRRLSEMDGPMTDNTEQGRSKDAIRNIAIIAHVDHGKTTLVDRMLEQSGSLKRGEAGIDRAMDSNGLERERGITILSKCTSLEYEDLHINVV